jgi:molybdopterin-synthase adenylyltransferase
MFTEEQLHRYSRHIILKGFGPGAQEKLLDSSVIVIGAGGLGSPALLYLAAAGVGTLGIADYDTVDISNLQRQILYNEKDLNKLKTAAASEGITELNSDVQITRHSEKIAASNILDIIASYDFVIDGTDTLRMKALVNDACIIGNKPFSHAGVLEFSGQIMTVIPHKSACMRCIIEELPDESVTCAQAGIIGAVTGVLGTLQALEAIKYLTDTGTLLTDSLLTFQGDITRFHKLHFNKNPKCPVCGNKPTIIDLNHRSYESCR